MEKLTFSQFNQKACRAHKEEDGLYRRLARHFGLADSALWILYVLEASQGPVTQAELCGYLSLSKQTVNSGLKQLEQEGYIQLTGGPGRKSFSASPPGGTIWPPTPSARCWRRRSGPSSV